MSCVSTEAEEQLTAVQPEDSSSESSKKSLRSYTREFLLSLSELEVCKKLPKGFDESLLSEFEEASSGIQDRSRVLGSSSLQGFKRTEYGSTARGESGNYSRGLNRWDSRSSGRSDTDSESESGRRPGSQARRSWQSPEHDGLLGSGSFPRPAGYAAGAPVPRFRPGENTHLNRSNEPYHPPRPYKAGPHSRREANDSFNDETFGSVDDSASEDRVEEEKKRKAEFELMRKEQQKALQEKQKVNQGKTDDLFSDIRLPENPSDGKTSSDVDKVLKHTPQDDSSKLAVSSQAPPYRPLVPPGFVSSVADKSSTAKSLVYAEPLEIGNLKPNDSHQDVKNKAQTSSTPDIKAEKSLNLSSVFRGADHAEAPKLPDVSEVLENGEIMGLDFEVIGPKLLGEPARSTSILDKLFGNASRTSNGSISKFVEDDTKKDDVSCSNTLHSKFACWFPEEERKPPGDISSEKQNNLLSLIVGGEIGGSNVPAVPAAGSIITPDTVLVHKMSHSASSTAEKPEQFSNSFVTEAKPAVLTCEDLEQSILSEFGGDNINFHLAGNDHHALELKAGHAGNNIDNQASNHLLSLLQKGIGSKDVASISVVEEKLPDISRDHEVGKVGVLDGSVIDGDGLNSPGKMLTLEALFGTAFMTELHSAQRNTLGSPRVDVPNGALFPSAVNENGFNQMVSNDRNTQLDKVGEWLGFNDALKEVELSKHQTEVDSKFGGICRGDAVALPEEDSLINLIDPINAENSMLVPKSGSFNLLPSSSRIPADVLEKLAVLGRAPKDERSMVGGHDLRLMCGPSDMVKPELPYQNLHPQASSPQLHVSQMNHNRPLFHALDSQPAHHLDPQLNFMHPEAMIHRDAPTRHQFPAHMGHPSFPHPSAALPAFDHPISPPILQQMHMAGNLPPPHLSRGFSGGAPMPPHPSHNPSGYIQEPNPVQNMPFGQRQSYIGGPGMGPTGPELGVANNPPESFQRFLEMELRANPKQMQPFAAGGHSRTMYGHELDTGFRYI